MKWFVVISILCFLGCKNVSDNRNYHDIDNYSPSTSTQEKIYDLTPGEMMTLEALDSFSIKLNLLPSEYQEFITNKINELNTLYHKKRCDGWDINCDSIGGWLSFDFTESKNKDVIVFDFFGEWIGAYGVPMYHSTIIYKGVEIYDSTMLDFKRLHQLSNGKHLLITSGLIRYRGPEFGRMQEAFLLSTNSINKIGEGDISMFIENSSGEVSFYDSSNYSNAQDLIKFDSNSNTLQIEDFELPWGSQEPQIECLKISKQFKYVNGKFHFSSKDSTIDIRHIHSQ